MTSAPDMTAACAPRSDQINAEDLLTGPRTVTITDVKRGSSEQPVDIVTAEYGPGRPYKPSKTMRRMIVAAWGTNSSVYIGRRLTIYRDPDITFGRDRCGGIRISHLSHIDERLEIALTVTRGRRASFAVDPLPDEPAAEHGTNSPTARDEVTFTPDQRRKGLNMMFALFADADIAKDNRDDRLLVTAAIVGETVASSNDLTDPQLFALVNKLRGWNDEPGRLGREVTEILNRATLAEMAAETDTAPTGAAT